LFKREFVYRPNPGLEKKGCNREEWFFEVFCTWADARIDTSCGVRANKSEYSVAIRVNAFVITATF
jgi:hypothetical protein